MDFLFACVCVYFRGKMRGVKSLFTLRSVPIPSLRHGPQAQTRTTLSKSAGIRYTVSESSAETLPYTGALPDGRVPEP